MFQLLAKNVEKIQFVYVKIICENLSLKCSNFSCFGAGSWSLTEGDFCIKEVSLVISMKLQPNMVCLWASEKKYMLVLVLKTLKILCSLSMLSPPTASVAYQATNPHKLTLSSLGLWDWQSLKRLFPATLGWMLFCQLMFLLSPIKRRRKLSD